MRVIHIMSVIGLSATFMMIVHSLWLAFKMNAETHAIVDKEQTVGLKITKHLAHALTVLPEILIPMAVHQVSPNL